MTAILLGALTAVVIVICAASHDIYATIFYALVLILLYSASIRTYWLYSHQLFQTYGSSKTRNIFVSVLAISILFGVVLEGLTLIGSPLSSPLQLSSWNLQRLAAFFLLCFFVSTYACAHFLSHKNNCTQASISKCNASSNLNALSITAFLIVAVGAAALLSGIFPWRLSGSVNRAFFLAICILVVVITLVVLRQKGSSRPELIFLTAALVSGTFLCFALPPVTAISPDDQIHFDRSLGLSYLGRSEYSDSEIQLANVPWVIDSVVQFNDLDKVIDELDSSHSKAIETGSLHTLDGFFSPVAVSSLLNITYIGYIPSAIGLWLGRLLGLPLTGIVILGRWANLLSYCGVFYFAIKNIPSKKTLMTVIALLPTSLYLASNYSYDPWVISMLALSFSNLCRELSKSDKTITLDGIVTICFPMLLGLCPKAVYFPVIGLLFLFPTSKFLSPSHRRVFFAGVVIFGVLVVSTFILPLFFSSAAIAGDARGGTDVNSGEQIAFIISHPIDFIKTLVAFLVDYISPINSDQYSISYFYMGTLSTEVRCFATIPFVLIIVTALCDGQGATRLNAGAIAWILFIVACTLGLVATSLYVSFTPVGLNWVNGCQARYILPILFLPLAIIGTCKSTIGETESATIQYAPIIAVGVLTVICNLLLVIAP
ncbi:DUF2142 domain-containing protein [Enorma massiliensis]|uniref:DUF2142 domain-containing protein n=1 Tax=Enorma massiliensis TaxID=1472761 RepID=UPI0034A4CB62